MTRPTPDSGGMEKKLSWVSCLRNEQGIALVIALLLVVVLMVVIPITVQMTASDMDRTKDYRVSRQAFYVAEAGIQMAMDGLTDGFSDSTYSSMDDVLAAKDASNVILSLNGVSFGSGSYTVTVTDNDDGDGDLDTDSDSVIFLISQATVEEGSKTIQARLGAVSAALTPGYAILTQGDFSLSGSPTIQGTKWWAISGSNQEHKILGGKPRAGSISVLAA